MTTRDWGGYGSIVEEAAAREAIDRDRPLLDCPRCGQTLVFNTADVGSCPMGHYRSRPNPTQEDVISTY